jgi:hypothetical protein
MGQRPIHETWASARVRAAAFAILVAGGLFGAPAAQAQTEIIGRVLEDGSEQAVAGAEILLIDAFDRVRARTLSDEAGEFRFRLGLWRAGAFRLRASRIGFASVRTGEFAAAPDEVVATEIRLKHDAILLAPLTVVARRNKRTDPVTESFHHRMARATSGHFISRQQIEQARPFNLSDLLATVPGVRLGPSMGAGGRMVYMARALPREGGCPPQVFVDGRLMNGRVLTDVGTSQRGNRVMGFRTDPGVRIDEFISIQSVEGVEIYSGISGVPAELYTPDARCGVIGIWTRI